MGLYYHNLTNRTTFSLKIQSFCQIATKSPFLFVHIYNFPGRIFRINTEALIPCCCGFPWSVPAEHGAGHRQFRSRKHWRSGLLDLCWQRQHRPRPSCRLYAVQNRRCRSWYRGGGQLSSRSVRSAGCGEPIPCPQRFSKRLPPRAAGLPAPVSAQILQDLPRSPLPASGVCFTHTMIFILFCFLLLRLVLSPWYLVR